MKVSIVGASGYGGGELLRLLLQHPQVDVYQCTSERFAGKPVTRLHPNLRKQTALKFCSVQDLAKVDLLFTALPHSRCMQKFEEFNSLAERIIDLSADFRLKDAAAYSKWYGLDHTRPQMLAEFVYGNVELHREEMRRARYISGAGCNATATILPLVAFVQTGNRGYIQAGDRGSQMRFFRRRQQRRRSVSPSGKKRLCSLLQADRPSSYCRNASRSWGSKFIFRPPPSRWFGEFW